MQIIWCLASAVVGVILGVCLAAYFAKKSAPLYTFVAAHFKPTSLATLTVTERHFPARVRVDLHRAIDQLLSNCDVANVCGIRMRDSMFGVDLSHILTYDTPAFTAPVEYEEVNIGEDLPVRCLKNTLWLLTTNETKVAILLSQTLGFNEAPRTRIDIATENTPSGAAFTRVFYSTLEESVRKAESYRGKVLSLEAPGEYEGQSNGITVHKLAPLDRSELILPELTLALLERNVVQFVRHRHELGKLGQSTKKGLLFHGPPGNGKTHTIRYLIGELTAHTTILVTGEQMGRLAEYLALARLLQPTLLVIEDVDLIAKSRANSDSPCQESLLNRLLNEMDGLTEAAEIIVIMTSNRPEELEEALAARPGRIDQVVEFPLPEKPGREKLARLYARSVDVPERLIQLIVDRTEGASAAFIKELMRRAIQFNLAHDLNGQLADRSVQLALEELVTGSGRFHRSVLGLQPSPSIQGIT